MSPRYDIESKFSLKLKDFKSKGESYVREEFLVPLFRSAGYYGSGSSEVLRSVHLAASSEIRGQRQYIYPDFVLAKNGIALWIVDAKAATTKANTNSSIKQIETYCRALKCPNGILSNALETHVYSITSTTLRQVNHFSINEVCGERWEELLKLLSAEETVARVISFEKALDLYRTDEYVNRSFIMKVLQVFPFENIRTALSQSLSNRGMPAFRERALPAILGTPHAMADTSIFRRVIRESLSDKDPVVRENLLTCLIAHRKCFSHMSLPREVYEINPATPLEEVVYLQFLATTPKGRRLLERYLPREEWLRSYIARVRNSTAVSFPVALPLGKPAGLSYAQYRRHLKSLPVIIERLVRDPRTHPETISVIKSCVGYSAVNNQGVFHFLTGSATKRERWILEEAARDRTKCSSEYGTKRGGQVDKLGSLATLVEQRN